MSRAQRIAHWVGVLLAAPIPLVTAIAFAAWLRGEFPATLKSGDVSIIVALAAGATILVYAICRAVGWTIAVMRA